MNKIFKRVLQGLGTVLPLGLTVYFIYWLLVTAETFARSVLLWVIPQKDYFTGLGILTALLMLFIVGLLVNAYGFRYIIQLGDKLVTRIPLVKSLYGAMQDIMQVFSIAEKKELKSVVTLDIGNDMHLIGFITGEQSGKSLFPEDRERVGVYLPMSYQIGGFTVYVERERLRALNMGVEEAMRIALTGGAQSSKTRP